MSEYQLIPIQAVQIRYDSFLNPQEEAHPFEEDTPKWIMQAYVDKKVAYNQNPGYKRWEVETVRGFKVPHAGDWIVRLGYERFAVMSDHEFEETYQLKE